MSLLKIERQFLSFYRGKQKSLPSPTGLNPLHLLKELCGRATELLGIAARESVGMVDEARGVVRHEEEIRFLP